MKPSPPVTRQRPALAAAASLLIAVQTAGLARGDGAIARELGPAGINNNNRFTGRVSAIVCSPTNSERYFVAGADGGVWRTDNAGLSWTPLTDRMPTLAIGALAMDPTNENVIYAGTGEANYANHSRHGLGIYKTTDGGATWTHLAQATFAGRCFSRIVINPQNTQTLYASVTRAGGFPELAAAKGHPGATATIGVFRSTDGGATWSPLSNGIPLLSATDLAIDPSTPTTIYAAIGHIFGNAGNGIYKSTNGGDSWTKLTSGMPSGTYGRISIAVSPSNPSRLYAMITNPNDASGGGASTKAGLRSDNGGSTWSTISLPSIQATYGWFLSVIRIHPTNPDIAFFGGLDLVRTNNAGASFVTVTPPHVDLHALAFDAAGRLLAGEDGGVHRSATLGDNWGTRNNNLGVAQLYAGISTHPDNANIFFAGLQDNGTNRRNTDSTNWTQVMGGDGGWTQIDQVNPPIVFCEFQGTGNLFRSTNGGGSFGGVAAGINTADRNCFLPPYLNAPDDSNRLYYATHRLYRSTNGGLNWSAISPDVTNGGGAIRALAIAPSNPQTMYAATNDGIIAVSLDGGHTFSTVVTSNPGWPRVTRELFVDPRDDHVVYRAVAAYGVSQIERSDDAGQSWTPLDVALPDVPVNVVAVDVRGPRPVIFAGSEQGLYRSIDDGGSWHRYGVGMPHAVVVDLLLETSRRRLIASTQGRGAWQIPIGLPGDLNDNGTVNPFDIQAFFIAVTDPDEYAAQFPDSDRLLLGDLNGDGSLNPFDVQPFVDLLQD